MWIGHCKEIRFILELTLAISFSLWWPIGPLQHSVTWYGINYAGAQKNAVGLPKQRNSYQTSPTFLCFESPTALFASQHNLFRTCDRVVQRNLSTQLIKLQVITRITRNPSRVFYHVMSRCFLPPKAPCLGSAHDDGMREGAVIVKVLQFFWLLLCIVSGFMCGH